MTRNAAWELVVCEAPLPNDHASDALLQAAGTGMGRASFGIFVAALGHRGFGIAILALALPNCTFAPPGFGSITGLLIAALAAQIMCGHQHPRLPGWLERRTVARTSLRKVVVTALPAVRRVERYTRPRLRRLITGRAEQCIGAFMLVQALIVALPLPLTNWLPGVALAVMAVGLIERDGAAVLAGSIIGLAALLMAVSVIGGLLTASAFFLGFTG